MMMNTSSSCAKNNNRYPFTAVQWQELEHQALIFKYMVSGNPIPHELLSTIKTTWDPFTNLLHLHQPQQIGWNHLQMGYGRKIDPEPGRCRRTDGKKWRCSKEAYPDSKYCERHMHRGRNRSRKPVEATNNTSSTLPNISSNPKKSPQKPPSSSITPYNNNNNILHSNLTSHQYVSSLYSQNNTSPFLYPQSTTFDKTHSYVHGIKEEVVEHSTFLSSSSGGTMKSMSGSSVGDSCWQQLDQQPLTMNKQSGYNYMQHSSREKQNSEWGDMMKMGREDEPQKVMHHFFDEWPKNKDSWEEEETQLSISMPTSSHHDFFRAHN